MNSGEREREMHLFQGGKHMEWNRMDMNEGMCHMHEPTPHEEGNHCVLQACTD